jgi:putative endonuclease
MKYYLYILKSLKDNKHYTGISGDVKKRLAQHNSGKTQSTKIRRPFVLIYTEEFNSRYEAREREKYFKSYRGCKDKIEILKNIGE